MCLLAWLFLRNPLIIRTQNKRGHDLQYGQSNTMTWLPSWGLRPDNTPKGEGYFGILERPDKGISSELSIDVIFDPAGRKRTYLPLIVPTLNKKELNFLLRMKDDDEIPKAIINKAISHAIGRMKSGRSPFADVGEKYPLPTE